MRYLVLSLILVAGAVAQTKPSAGTAINTLQPISSGIIGAWLFGEGSGATAANSASGGVSCATSNTGVSWGTGNFSGADLAFSGVSTAHADCASFVSSSTNHITVLAWVKPATAQRGDLVNIWSNGSASSQFDLIYNLSAGHIAFYLAGGSNPSASGSRTISTGSWHQIVGTYDGSTVTDYIDGAIDGSTSTSITLNTSGLTALRFANNAVGDGSYIGSIDHVIIWNRALSSTEISTLYSNPFLPWQAVSSFAVRQRLTVIQ